jgi:hypothetical protein
MNVCVETVQVTDCYLSGFNSGRTAGDRIAPREGQSGVSFKNDKATVCYLSTFAS